MNAVQLVSDELYFMPRLRPRPLAFALTAEVRPSPLPARLLNFKTVLLPGLFDRRTPLRLPCGRLFRCRVGRLSRLARERGFFRLKSSKYFAHALAQDVLSRKCRVSSSMRSTAAADDVDGT